MLLSRSNTTRDEAIKKILQKARVEKSISQIVFELTFARAVLSELLS
jgi:hypothetical protein